MTRGTPEGSVIYKSCKLWLMLLSNASSLTRTRSTCCQRPNLLYPDDRTSVSRLMLLGSPRSFLLQHLLFLLLKFGINLGAFRWLVAMILGLRYDKLVIQWGNIVHVRAGSDLAETLWLLVTLALALSLARRRQEMAYGMIVITEFTFSSRASLLAIERSSSAEASMIGSCGVETGSG